MTEESGAIRKRRASLIGDNGVSTSSAFKEDGSTQQGTVGSVHSNKGLTMSFITRHVLLSFKVSAMFLF